MSANQTKKADVRYQVPITYYVYEFSYPEQIRDVAGIIFYVGKGSNLRRMDDHLNEAAKGCSCHKCETIRLIWDAGFPVTRRIVFESLIEKEALEEETRRIITSRSIYLTNIKDGEDDHAKQSRLKGVVLHRMERHSLLMLQKAPYPNRLRALIRSAGLNFRKVQRATGIGESTLYTWASGKNAIPQKHRVTLAELIGCSPQDLAPIKEAA